MSFKIPRTVGDESEAAVWMRRMTGEKPPQKEKSHAGFSKVWAPPETKVRDAAGHEHASDGRFGSGGDAGKTDDAPPEKPRGRSVLGRLADATAYAGKILESGYDGSKDAVAGIKEIARRAMVKVEERYGSKVKNAVGIAVLLSLPVPVPGMSAVVAAPILAFAEIFKQLGIGAKAAEEEPDDETVKKLVKEVLAALFDDKVPDNVDPEKAFAEEGDEKRYEPITKTFVESDHPRNESGEFSASGAGFSAVKPEHVADLYNGKHGAFRDLKTSQVNAAMRAAAAMTDSEAKQALKDIDQFFLPNKGTPQEQIIHEFMERRGAQLRVAHGGGRGKEGDEEERKKNEHLYDERLISVEQALASAGKEPSKKKKPKEEEVEVDDRKRYEPITKRYPKLHTKDTAAAPVKFDDQKLTADAVISTREVDRDGEVMIPAGCDLTAFNDYAPWFLNHQGGAQLLFPFPIGSGKERPTDPSCLAAVFIEKDHIWARCHFNRETPEAEITYRLWKLGHMGATSVGFEGTEHRDLQGREAEMAYGAPKVREYTKWQLCEISIVGLGANREALAMHASRGHVEKMTIPDSLKRWFATFAQPIKLFTVPGNPLDTTPPILNTENKSILTFGNAWGKKNG